MKWLKQLFCPHPWQVWVTYPDRGDQIVCVRCGKEYR